MSEQLSYASAIAELEQIVAKMQSDNCDIDSLSGYTTRAMELLKYCKQKLFTTDEEVKKCLESLNS
ncbi:MAG: exodeoxyribonuclease VII small subunit [Muribaculaceae bacterium]|jgi:exodeoxyribonuclease VII small subunit